MNTWWKLFQAVVSIAGILIGAAASPVPAAQTRVTLQLQWVTQSQFAGYYAAVEQGFYRDEGLDVAIKVGAVEIVPQQVVASGGADFGIAWLPKVLASREQGAKLINVLKNGPTLGIGHMTWMLNEINALIWPSPQGVGMMESRAFEQTVRIAQQYQIVKNRPDAGTYRTDLAQQALADLTAQGLDVKGLGFQKRAVQVTRGGE
jgi:hypothetical protein